MDIWRLGLPPNSGGTKGGGDRLVGGIHWTQEEYGGTVHFHLAHHEPMTGSAYAPGGQGFETVVGSGQPTVSGSTGGAVTRGQTRRTGGSGGDW